MGCSCEPKVLELGINEDYFNLYKNIKELINKMKDENQLSLETYLITTKSIPNFIRIINQSKIFDYLDQQNDELYLFEQILEKSLQNCEIDTNIKILSNFVECFSLAEQDIEKENEFIIVDDDLFLPSINIKNKKYIEIEIDNTDKNNSKKIIRFNDSDRVIGFK